MAQIVKSLIFQTSDTQNPVLALVSGANQVDVTRLEQAMGEKIVKADPPFVKKITGFAIGGVPPLGHKEHIAHIYIDQDLLAHDFVWAAAGTPECVFCIKTQALISLTQGCILDLASRN